jgi:hypothetical protein
LLTLRADTIGVADHDINRSGNTKMMVGKCFSVEGTCHRHFPSGGRSVLHRHSPTPSVKNFHKAIINLRARVDDRKGRRTGD